VSHEGYTTKIVPGLDVRGGRELRADIELRALGDGGSREELSGIGAMLGPSTNGVAIVGLIDGGPAARAGLMRGDRIVRIDGAEAADLTISDCVQRLRGQPGTRVGIAVDRGGTIIEMTLQRETVVR
jgi:C-terminal processing protease CtpA/Prc